MKLNRAFASIGFVAVTLALAATVARGQDPLPSWDEGATKQAIVDFVAKVTKEGSPEQVVGSSIKTKLDWRDGEPVLVRLPEMNFIGDKGGKPVGINEHIGRRPIAAFGNSDGDQQMLEWTQAGSGARLMMLVHHDDAEREWAYGAESKIGTFSDALMAEAKKVSWTVISMKRDWRRIFPFEPK